MSSKIDKERALNVLQFVGRAFSPIVPVASTVASVIDLAQAAAQIRYNPSRQNQSVLTRAANATGSASLEKAAAFVERHLSAPYSEAKGKMRQEMIAAISHKLLDDPHAKELLDRLS